MDLICMDLAAEQDSLDAIVSDLSDGQWAFATAAGGWDVRQTIVHLAYFDDAARAAVVDPADFAERRAGAATGALDVERRYASLSGADVLEWWRRGRAGLLAGLRPLRPKDRVSWFGPPMSALSFATARLMETWSHGWDVAEALQRPRPSTDRLRHVAHLGVSTRGWSYANRGMSAPVEPVRVELVAPSGSRWAWGPETAEDTVKGAALDFCLVVTQRRRVADTDLEVVGGRAEEWMEIAQAFAGPPTLTDEQRSAR
jgi:uncharacterized protein (TIGR03084 family)